MPIFNPMLVWGGIKLVSIDITNPPNNVNYQTGQSFDPAGMEVTATYSSGATLLATGWTYSPNGALTEETQSITIVYTEGGVSAQATQAITVQREDSFADSEWSEIIAACQSGSVPDSWGVGDSKPMTINGTSYQIDIIGKNHDEYADGSGKAPLTFQMHDCYADTKDMNGSATNSGGWGSCDMRTTHLPAIKALMPAEVQAGLKKVQKLTSAGNQSSDINTTEDDLFLLSEVEIFGSLTHSKSGEGTQYDYYSAGNSRVKNQNGGVSSWWERSPRGSVSSAFCIVSGSGNANRSSANASIGVAFGFCF